MELVGHASGRRRIWPSKKFTAAVELTARQGRRKNPVTDCSCGDDDDDNDENYWRRSEPHVTRN
jgi:hypothetical protein